MQELKELDDIAGKTIKAAVAINCDVVIRFLDDTYIVIGAISTYECDPEVVVGVELDHIEKCQAGIINIAERDRITSELRVESDVAVITREMAILSKLKEKYEGDE